MKLLRLMMVALAVMVVSVVMATEPSKLTVKYQGKKYYVHTVAEGDTLYSLSKVYGVSQESIIEVNKLKSNDIRVGSTVYVPYAEPSTTTAKQSQKPKQQSASDGEHVVSPGETLYSLSRKYGISEQELLDMNGLKDHTDIKAGMVLRVRKGDKNGASSNSDSRNGTTHSRRDNNGEMYKGDDGEKSRKQNHSSDQHKQSESASDATRYNFGDVHQATESTSYMFERLSPNTVLQVTLLLPFHARNEAKENIVDFYRGVLLAMEDLKNEGYSIELTVLDTKRSAERINELIIFGELDTQLIIGPVYEEEFAPILRYAEMRNIPVISPLQYVTHDSPVLFNMPAPASLKGEPVAGLLDGSREVITIYATSNDNNFIREVRSIATHTSEVALNFRFDRGSYFYSRNSDGSNGVEVNIEELMRDRRSKVFVIMASSNTDVDRILTTLSSTKSSLRGRGLTYGDYMVVGNREWLKMANLDHDIFFHNNTVFVVPYYANRIDEAVRLFDGRYVSSFGALPSRTSYRGYDAAMIFCRMMYEGFDNFLGTTYTPLTTPYCFEYLDGSYTNTNWVRQHYRQDSKIVVE